MKLDVRLFARARDAAGAECVTVELPAGARVADLRAALAAHSPNLRALVPCLLVAVGTEYADDPRAFVAKGRGRLLSSSQRRITTMQRLSEEPIDFVALTESVRSTDSGAVVLFLGTVREMTNGRRTTALDYEAFGPMAESKLAEIEAEARRRWTLDRVAIAHRLGRLELGEVSVAVAVSSPHRAEAFEAARYLIDTLEADRADLEERELARRHDRMGPSRDRIDCSRIQSTGG